MTSITLAGHLNTVALESLIVKALRASKLDKDGDGKVSRSEIFAALADMAPEFFNFQSVIDEVRDLDNSELQHLINVATNNLPDYPNVRAEVEDFVKAILEMTGCLTRVIVAYKRMNVPPAIVAASVAKSKAAKMAEE